MFCSDAQTLTARKRHRCTWCGELVQAGEKYTRYFWADGGDAGAVKMHPECLDAMHEEAEGDSGYEFMPYDHERPRLEAAHG